MKKLISMLLCLGILITTMSFAYASAERPIEYPNLIYPSFTGSATNHTLLLSYGGTVTAWGSNLYGECAKEPCDKLIEPNYIHFEDNHKIIQVAAGNDFSLALDNNGTVWGWGNNIKNQLGIINAEGMSHYVVPQKCFQNAKKIAAGMDYSLVLNCDGSLYISDNTHIYQKIETLINIKYVAAKYDRIMAVDENNNLYFWKYGDSPNKIDLPVTDEIINIAVGKEHCCIALKGTDKISLYSFGDNTKHQLGTTDTVSEVPVLTTEYIWSTDEDYDLICDDYQTVFNVYDINPIMYTRMLKKSIEIGTSYNGNIYETATEVDRQNNLICFGNGNSVNSIMERSINDFYVNIVLNGDNSNGQLLSEDSAITENIIPLLSSNIPQSIIYQKEYDNTKYFEFELNFVELTSETLFDDYDYFEYIDNRHFKAKCNNLVKEIGMYIYNPANGEYTISENNISFNVPLTSDSVQVWNFDDFKYSYGLLGTTGEITKENVNGSDLILQIKKQSQVTNLLNFETPVFSESPYPLNDNTKLGLYIYNLPVGVVVDEIMAAPPYGVEIILKGTIKDLDYDCNPNVCYIFSLDSNEIGTSLGECDKLKIISANEKIKGVKFVSTENTSEKLSITSDILLSGKEDGNVITIKLQDGIFNSILNVSNWSVSGFDDNVNIANVERLDDTTAQVTLSGNSIDKFTDKIVSVTCTGDEYSDSRIYNEETGEYTNASLTSENTLTFAKQNKSSGGGSSGISTYTVTFNNDGNKTIQKVKRNAEATCPEDPTKDGYMFDGWYTEKELTVKYDFTANVTKPLTLYAKWIELPIDNSKNEIVLTIDKKEASVFGESKTNDVAPKIVNDRNMLPSRFIAESLGAKVEWNEEKQTVTITKGDITIIITIGSKTALVNGKEVTLDSPAFIENDRTYTPIRFISEKLGAKVEWNNDTKEITIYKYIN